jgi:hypothetical protein
MRSAAPPPLTFATKVIRALSIAVPLLAMGTTLFVFQRSAATVAREVRTFPLDSYFYQSMASNIREGKGPCVDWPQGPHNKYFPGFAYWWALFIPRGVDPEVAIRSYVSAQTVLLAFFMIALALLGRAVWRTWPVALTYASLAGSASIVLKWGAFPMSELMTAVCTTACAASVLFLLREPTRDATPSASRAGKWIAWTSLVISSAVGVFTRIEAAYVVGLLVLWLLRRGRIRWTGAAGILLTAAAPLALWQLWVTRVFHQANAYVAEGLGSFQTFSCLKTVLFLFSFFIRVPNVDGPCLYVNTVLIVPSLLFMAFLIVALRGYLGRLSALSAWLMAGYWGLHGLWYYSSERYNCIVAAFGFLFFMEGLGWLYDRRRRWRAKGTPIVLIAACLFFVPVFVQHGRDNMEATLDAIHKNQPPLPANQGEIRAALERDPHRPAQGPVFLTNLNMGEVRHLPGIVWSENPDYVLPPYAPGKAQPFMRAKGVTHLALKPPADEWLRVNGQGLHVQVLYQDEMVWLARVDGLGGSPSP